MFLQKMLVNILLHHGELLLDPTKHHLFGFGNGLDDKGIPIIDSLQDFSL